VALDITRKFTGSSLQLTPQGWLWREVYTVTGTTSKLEAIEGVIAAYPVHPVDPRMLIDYPDASNVGLNVFDVSAGYKLTGRTDDDPLNAPTVFNGDIELVPRMVDRDIDGNPIVNSALAPFEGGAPETHSMLVLRCQRNIPSFDVGQGMLFSGAVNSDAFTTPGLGTVDAGNCLCRIYRPVGDWHFGDAFVRVEAVFAFDTGKNPFDFKPIDAGKSGWYSGNDGTERGNFIGGDGNEPGFDVKLDGTGKPIEAFKVRSGPAVDAQPKSPVPPPSQAAGLTLDTDLSTSALKVLIWKTKKRADFRALPF
jgi:hypothetical protein